MPMVSLIFVIHILYLAPTFLGTGKASLRWD
jgi:hypothetical protein